MADLFSGSNWLLDRALALPDDLSREDWRSSGEALARLDDAQQWRWGDWLLAAKPAWGEMYDEAQRISGKDAQTLQVYKYVASRYQSLIRIKNLSWSHYRVAASIDEIEIRMALLARAEAEGWSVSRLREEMSPKLKWRADEIARKEEVERGNAVVASMRTNGDGRRHDEALLNWAEATGDTVRIDRATAWGNPFETPADGERDEVIANFRDHFLPFKPSLQARLWNLRGKVLVCWCHPEPCHGDVICETVNLLEEG